MEAGDSHSGRVEVFYQGEWGTVCDNGWNLNAGRVACKMLGFSDVTKIFTASKSFGGGSGKIWLGGLDCNGVENSLFDCDGAKASLDSTDCSHDQDAGVECKKKNGK